MQRRLGTIPLVGTKSIQGKNLNILVRPHPDTLCGCDDTVLEREKPPGELTVQAWLL